MYKQCLEILKNLPYVSKYFTPVLELPEEVNNRLNQLTVKLFPFQLDFLKSYYNAKHKLGMDGYILAFDMGLGKTFTAISSVYAFNLIPTIITAPRSVVPGWVDSIMKMIPNVKREEIKVSYEYNPNKDHTKWKYFICNYERLDMALKYVNYSESKPKSILVDEAHNFRFLNTNRSQMLLNIKKELNIKDVIAISGSPIKALASELIPIMKLIDPTFDNEASDIFKKIYSKNSYDPINGSVIRNRLNFYIERKKQEDSIKLPPIEKYNIEVKLNDPTPYLIDTLKKNINEYYNKEKDKYIKDVEPSFQSLLTLLKNNIIIDNINKDDIDFYVECVTQKRYHPFDKSANISIKSFENKIKNIDKIIYKKIIELRSKITSWALKLIGKAVGINYTQKKILLLSEMVKENLDAICDIIKSAEKKVIIFSTFVDPLEKIQKLLNENNIGSIVHSGKDDVNLTKEKFMNNDNIKVLLGTTKSIGTGVDGLQFIANEMIFLNQEYRAVDTLQNIKRIHRKGQDKTVRIYFLHLNTDDPNILENESLINEWSRQMFNILVN